MKNIEKTRLGRVLTKNRLMRVLTVATLLFVTTEANQNRNMYSQASSSKNEPAYDLSEKALSRLSEDETQALIVKIANSMPDTTAYKMIDSIADIRSRYVDYRWVDKVFKKTLKNTQIHSEIIDTAFVRYIADKESGTRHNPYIRHNPEAELKHKQAYLRSDSTAELKHKKPKMLRKPSGARGAMELVQGGWHTVDKQKYIANVYNLRKNLVNGIRLLEHIEKFCEKRNPDWATYDTKTKLEQIALVYNAGPKIILDNHWNMDSVYRKQETDETRNYVAQIEDSWSTDSTYIQQTSIDSLKYVAQLDSQSLMNKVARPMMHGRDSLEYRLNDAKPANDSIVASNYQRK